MFVLTLIHVFVMAAGLAGILVMMMTLSFHASSRVADATLNHLMVTTLVFGAIVFSLGLYQSLGGPWPASAASFSLRGLYQLWLMSTLAGGLVALFMLVARTTIERENPDVAVFVGILVGLAVIGNLSLAVHIEGDYLLLPLTSPGFVATIGRYADDVSLLTTVTWLAINFAIVAAHQAQKRRHTYA